MNSLVFKKTNDGNLVDTIDDEKKAFDDYLDESSSFI